MKCQVCGRKMDYCLERKGIFYHCSRCGLKIEHRSQQMTVVKERLSDHAFKWRAEARLNVLDRLIEAFKHCETSEEVQWMESQLKACVTEAAEAVRQEEYSMLSE